MLVANIAYFQAKPVNIPKITILVDHGYHPEKIQEALEEAYPQVMRKIRFERSPKPSKAEKDAAGKSGFVPVATRWVRPKPVRCWFRAKKIERSNAWMDRCKSLVKNFERTLDHAKCKIDLCFVRLMLKRLAAA